MLYELFQKGPEVYIPVMLVSLLITVLAYGAFPLIFAKKRNTLVTKKKYIRICYTVNLVVMILFIAFNGGVLNGGPYLLWTWAFSTWGIKILGSRGVMKDSDYLEDDSDRIIQCKNCGYEDKKYFDACPKCGNYSKQYLYPNKTPVKVNELQKNVKKTKTASQVLTANRTQNNKRFMLYFKKEGLIWDIVNVFVLVLPVMLSIIAIVVHHNKYYNDEGLYYYYDVEGLYVPILILGAAAVIIKVVKLIMDVMVVSRIGTIIINAISFGVITIMLVPFLTEDIWFIDSVIAIFVLLPILYVWLFDLYKSLFKFFVKKYYSSQSYKMRCYKKINLINDYREKGVITEDEYQETRKQIISKIR